MSLNHRTTSLYSQTGPLYGHIIIIDNLFCPWGKKALAALWGSGVCTQVKKPLTFSLNSTRLIRTLSMFPPSVWQCPLNWEREIIVIPRLILVPRARRILGDVVLKRGAPLVDYKSSRVALGTRMSWGSSYCAWPSLTFVAFDDHVTERKWRALTHLWKYKWTLVTKQKRQ